MTEVGLGDLRQGAGSLCCDMWVARITASGVDCHLEGFDDELTHIRRLLETGLEIDA